MEHQAAEPGISVILPLHSGAQFLAESIDSVLAQNTDELLELVIALDRPDDACLAVLERYSDARIRTVDVPVGGVANAHNAALFAAKFDLVAVMHSDDVMLPERLAAQSTRLRQDDSLVAVGGQLELIDEHSHTVGPATFPCGVKQARRASRHTCPLAHPASMYRRDIAWELGGYRQDFAPAEDYDLWLRMLEVGELDNLPVQVLRYRRHGGQLSQTSKVRQANAKYDALDAAKRRRHRPGSPDSAPASVGVVALCNRARKVRFELALDRLAHHRLSGNLASAIAYLALAACLAPVALCLHAETHLRGRGTAAASSAFAST